MVPGFELGSLSILRHEFQPNVLNCLPSAELLLCGISSPRMRMAHIKSNGTTCVDREVVKRNIYSLLVKCYLVQSLWKSVWGVLKELRIGLPYDQAIPLLGIYYSQTEKHAFKKDMYTSLFMAAWITVKIWNQLRCPVTDEWIKKMWYIYTHAYTHGIVWSYRER